MRLIFGVILLTAHMLVSAQQADSLQYCIGATGVGVGGYDVVSYFQGNTPEVGRLDILAKHDGVVYFFSSEANRKAFIANPQKFLPEFGGWCSMTLAMGRATRPKYDNFLIRDEKLYLFERTLSVNGKELWQKDPARNQQVAAKNYQQYRTTGKIQ